MDILKKILILVIIALVIFLIVNAINKKYTPIEYEEKVVLNNGIEFTIIYNQIVKELLPTNYNSGYSYYKLFDKEQSILDIKAEMLNTRNRAIELDSIFKKVDIVIGKKHYTATVAFEDELGKDFIETTGKEIKPNQKLMCHFCLGVGDNALEKEGQAILNIKTAKGKFEYKMDIKSLDENTKNEESTININYQGKKIYKDDVITIPDVCAFKLVDANFTGVVEPSHKGVTYKYLTAAQGKLYVDVKIVAKNLTSDEKLQEEMLGYCTFVDGNNKYDLIKIVEDSNGSNISTQTNIDKISPNQEILYHMVVEIPKDVIDTTNKLYINMYINGENYIYEIR